MLNLKSRADSFTEYRKQLFHHSKCSSMLDLPPTSTGIKLHIRRAFFAAKIIATALDSPIPQFNPRDYGFVEVEKRLLPSKEWFTLPDSVTIVCSCGKCARCSCSCRSMEVKCVEFCKCQRGDPADCKNPKKNL